MGQTDYRAATIGSERTGGLKKTVPSDQLDKTKTRAPRYKTSVSRWFAYAYLLAVLAGSLLLSLLLDPPHGPQHWLADVVTSNFSTRLKRHYPRIALVYVSAATLDHYHCPYLSPIDRGLLAKLIRAIDDAGAKVIGLDIILDRPTELNKDDMLRQTIRHTKAKVVVGAIDEPVNGSHTQSEFFFAGGDGNDPDIGHIYFDTHDSSLVVSDHVTRFIEPPYKMIKLLGRGEIHKSFAEALAQADGVFFMPQSLYIDWLLPPPLQPNGERDTFGWLHDFMIWLKHAAIALSTQYIPWLSPSEKQSITLETETFRTLSAEEVLSGKNAEELYEKVVIIGVNFDDRDQHLTPLSVSGEFYTGAFIHAQILAQLLDRCSIREMVYLQFLVALTAGCVGYWLGRHSRRYHIWFELGSVFTLVVLCCWAFAQLKLILPYNLILILLLGGLAAGHYGRLHAKIQEPE